jgi:TatD family-associated radical SAM protein
MTNTYVYKLENSLYVNLTNKCSNACDFCVRNTDTGIGDYDLWLETEPTASQVIQQIADPKQYNEIVFCGYGEPTIKLDELLEIAAWVKVNGGKVRINTNGQANLIHGKMLLLY